MGNYPGFPKISGAELASKWQEHLRSVGAEIVLGQEIKEIKKSDDLFEIKISENLYQSKSLILALGLARRKINVPGEKEFERKGVSYCVTCDGPLFRDKTVFIVGGGDAGASGAVFLSSLCKKIYLIEMEDKLSAEKIWQDKIASRKNIEVILGNSIKEIKGDDRVREVILSKELAGKKEISCDGVFVEIGSTPDTNLPKSLGVEVDQKGFIKVDPGQATNIKGLFAAGDTTTNSNFFWQVLTAMSEGAIAANSVNKYLKKQ